MNDKSPMPFGSHKDKEMEKVPASYLLWLYDEMRKKGANGSGAYNVFCYIEDNWSALDMDRGDYISEYKPNNR